MASRKRLKKTAPATRKRFTKATLSALPLPEKGARSTVYDTEVPKLAIRLTAAGARTFYVVKRDGASMSWVKLGTFPEMTPEGARKAAERVLGDFAKGINPATAKRAERDKQTLGEAYEQYRILHVAPRGIKSAEAIHAIWERCLGPMPDAPVKKHGRKRTKHPSGVDWSKRKLDAIDNAAIRALHAGIGKTHKTMANRVIETAEQRLQPGYRGGIQRQQSNRRHQTVQGNEARPLHPSRRAAAILYRPGRGHIRGFQAFRPALSAYWRPTRERARDAMAGCRFAVRDLAHPSDKER